MQSGGSFHQNNTGNEEISTSTFQKYISLLGCDIYEKSYGDVKRVEKMYISCINLHNPWDLEVHLQISTQGISTWYPLCLLDTVRRNEVPVSNLETNGRLSHPKSFLTKNPGSDWADVVAIPTYGISRILPWEHHK